MPAIEKIEEVLERRNSARSGSMIVIASAHFSMMILRVFDRNVITVPVHSDVLAVTVDNPFWYLLNAGVVMGIVASLITRKHQLQAMAASSGVMGAWAFLNLLWGLDTFRPVSLAGPVLGAVVAALSYLVAITWAHTESRVKRSHDVVECMKVTE